MVTPIEYYPLDVNRVIEVLCSYEEFNRFYHGEYGPREGNLNIEWCISPTLHGSWAESCVNLETGNDAIILGTFPVACSDYVTALLAAHEVLHIIRKIEMQSITIEVNENYTEYADAAKNLNSMFEDYIVDSILQDRYGFDLDYFYAEVDLRRCTSLLRLPNIIEPTQKADVLRDVFLYACQSLKWDLIHNDRSRQKWHEYQVLFREKYPHIWPSGEELLSVVRESRLGTIEDKKDLFENIVNMYDVEDILYII